ncbi:MAG TPA: amidohydrolase family protein, partial [Gaiellaceae bacterium]|nr:amidohydrolase family protein [Gaiellaceae bacterium]
SGVVITSGEELAEIIRGGARAGWPVGVHAIGDRANREALDAFESTRGEWAPLGLRQRVEHAQCVAPEDIARFAAIGVACSVQFSHAPSDRDLAERFWAEKTAGAYAFRSLWDSGALVANGSDAPVEELDPLAGVRAGVLRSIDQRPAWHPEQCLTVEEALLASTVNPAWLSNDERRRGRLLPGYLADLVVLSSDPLECPPDELESVAVVATMVGGRWVHNPPPWD